MTRFCAVTAPALMLAYGILRWIDGLNGQRHDGPAWDLGHLAFLIAIALFAALALTLRRAVRDTRRRPVADIAAAATLVGAGCFEWVILGDLFAGVHDTAPVFVKVAGHVLFQAGMLTLLLLLVLARPRRLPAWSPVIVLLGFAVIPVSLDLLPLAAILVGAGLLPLAVPATRHPARS